MGRSCVSRGNADQNGPRLRGDWSVALDHKALVRANWSTVSTSGSMSVLAARLINRGRGSGSIARTPACSTSSGCRRVESAVTFAHSLLREALSSSVLT